MSLSDPTDSVHPVLAQLRAGELKGCQRLDLSAGLTAFPPEIFELSDSLEILNLSGNQLEELPEELPCLRRLRILFCSENRFTRLPAVLGRCPQLSMIGFKANQICEVPAEAFPSALRWLILTDNQIEHLPETLGRCEALQKLMLAGNRLRSLPEGLGKARRLELMRVSSNQLSELPSWVWELPRLAWLAAAGNPVVAGGQTEGSAPEHVSWGALELGELLGEGASGRIYRASWKGEAVAVKVFKHAVTSDGSPQEELAACLAAGRHPNLISLLGVLRDHPEGASGIVLRLLPERCAIVAKPPSLDSCTRDVYAEGVRFGREEAVSMALQVAEVSAHLHGRGILHGDLYAHNLAYSQEGACFLGDFGAATRYPRGANGFGVKPERVEVLAFGHLLGELLERVQEPVPMGLKGLQGRCVTEQPGGRPLFAEVCRILKAFR